MCVCVCVCVDLKNKFSGEKDKIVISIKNLENGCSGN